MRSGDSNLLSVVRAEGKAHTTEFDRLNHRVSALYETYRDKVYRFLLAQGVSREVAQDITQDVFVKLFIALRNGAEISSEQAWIFSVAAKTAVDHWRREGHSAWVELETEPGTSGALISDQADPERLAARAQRYQRVAHTFAQLPREQRLCVQLRLEGLRYREIARILGVGISTAAGWLSTAVERLRGTAHD